MRRADGSAFLGPALRVAAWAALCLSPAVDAQPEPRFEILVIDHTGAGVRGRVFLILPDNKEKYLTETNDRGIATPLLSRCQVDHRIVVKPTDVSYFQSTDVPCPEISLRLEFRLYQRGGEVSSERSARATTNMGDATAPVTGVSKPLSGTESQNPPRRLRI